MKTCIKCKQEKSVLDFYKAKTNKDGTSNSCKICAIAAVKARSDASPGSAARKSKAWYWENRDKALAQSVKWRTANPEKASDYAKVRSATRPGESAARAKAWRLANPERFASVGKAWRAAHPEYKQKNPKQWGQNNPEKITAFVAAYRSQKLMAIPSWSNMDLIIEIYAKAKKMTADTGIEHHVDHIVPLQSKLVCGLHVHNNLRVITAKENRKKSNSFTI